MDSSLEGFWDTGHIMDWLSFLLSMPSHILPVSFQVHCVLYWTAVVRQLMGEHTMPDRCRAMSA